MKLSKEEMQMLADSLESMSNSVKNEICKYIDDICNIRKHAWGYTEQQEAKYINSDILIINENKEKLQKIKELEKKIKENI